MITKIIAKGKDRQKAKWI